MVALVNLVGRGHSYFFFEMRSKMGFDVIYDYQTQVHVEFEYSNPLKYSNP